MKSIKTNKMLEIQAIEDKYGLVLFRMGLTHLIDVGIRHLDDESVAESIKQIEAQGEADKNKKGTPVMTTEFQCNIVRCAAELAKISIWSLIAYIKKYVVAQ